MRVMKSPFWFLPSLAMFTSILLLSTVLTVSIQIDGIDYTDKLSHAFAYFALVVTLLLAFHKNEMLQGNTWLYLILACSIYGAMLEVIQYTYFPNRYFEWLDASANISGAILGGFAFWLALKAYGK